MNYRRFYSNKKDKSSGVVFNQIIKPNNYNSCKDYPEKMRMIKYYDSIAKNNIIFMPNDFLIEGNRNLTFIQKIDEI
jgi:hypothetical protein